MSLVEQTIKKMQAARGAATPAPAPARPVEPQRTAAAPVVRSARKVRVDRTALTLAGVLAPPGEERVLAQQFRQIKRPLVANALGRGAERVRNGQLIMMASALPGDGKTFTSVNLALSLALEKDVRTLLVDADFAKAHISRVFGIENEPGLLDVLRDESLDVESVILETDVPGLSILPAGRASTTATELLASPRMQAVVAQLGGADAGRIALFDSPPLLLTTESCALAGVVGQVVLVVCAGVTPRNAVLQSIDLLGGGKAIGVVLNQSQDASQAGYHRYYGLNEAAEGEKEGG